MTNGSGFTRNFTICDQNTMNNSVAQCEPNDWIWKCTINFGNCIYFYTCNLNVKAKAVDCTMAEHKYDSIVCCNPSCKTGN